MARAQVALMEDHAELIAAADSGPPGRRRGRRRTSSCACHIGVLIREADPDADWEMLADLLLAPLTAESFVYWCRLREQDASACSRCSTSLVDRLFPD